jgi:hypothetical protein
MRIDSSGNVGIGITPVPPTAYNGLHVHATYPVVKLSATATGSTATDGFAVRIDSTPRVELWNFENTDMVFGTNNTERMRITSAGLLQFNSGYGSVATAFGCRAWVNFNGTGTPAIRGSGNVTSITDLGTGQYRVNFTTAMPDENYCAVITHENIDYGGTSFIQSVAGMTASLIEIASYDIAGLKYQDTDIYCVAIFR